MTTYYRLELIDGDIPIPSHELFISPEAASALRDAVIADSGHWAWYFVVEQGCPMRIVEVTERVVREFPGLPVEGEA